MKPIKVLVSALALLVALSGCAADKTEAPTHKARASACLIVPEKDILGSPEKQLAYDLVEAKVVYGLNAKEISVPANSSGSAIEELLFNSLKDGCVYFLATDPQLTESVSSFVGSHKYVVGLIVGGDQPANQPANLRWVADDVASGAALAGFAAAAKSTTDNVYLILQDGYFAGSSVQAAFTAGVSAYNENAKKNIDLTVFRVSGATQAMQKLDGVNSQVVLAVFAGDTTWKELAKSEFENLLGSDLLLGQSEEIDERVFASVERNMNASVLDAARDLLDKKFYLDPKLSQNDALGSGLIELRPKDDTVFDSATSDLLAAYKAQLIANRAN
jgi:basic membrane lipoprotein Med (substrate-binding protein (PBP1-ABC) superfamily)